MLPEKLYIAESPIHGNGLFAKTDIQEGEILGTIQGRRAFSNGPYILWVTEHYGLRITCDFRFINHSDDPNVCIYDTLEVCALRDIEADEELTHDYEATED